MTKKPLIYVSYDISGWLFENKLMTLLKAQNVTEMHEIYSSSRDFLKIDAEVTKHLIEASKNKISESQIIILFVSPQLFSSQATFDKELIQFLNRIEQYDKFVFPIIARPIPQDNLTNLKRFNVWPRGGMALSELDSISVEIELTKLASEIASIVRDIHDKKLRTPVNNTADTSSVKTISSRKAPISVFISYSHKDEKLKDELVEHLSGLKNNNVISDWTDRKLLGGEKWDESIKHNLENSKIILFLISASFMSSSYINEIEIKRAIEKHEKREAIVVPIILRNCDYESLSLLQFQALPKNAKPIEEWKPRAKGWVDVVSHLKDIITNLQ